MRRDIYSSKDWTELKQRLNSEISRRATFKWWDPLSQPKVGSDRSSPLSVPEVGDQIPVDDKTYTINTPSAGSIEETENIEWPNHNDNPGGYDYENFKPSPHTSAAPFTYKEMRNFLAGLSKIHDIETFYGRDEVPGLAYRDPKPIYDLLEKAEKDKLHELASEYSRVDPNQGYIDKVDNDWPNIRGMVGAKLEDGNLYSLVEEGYSEPDLEIVGENLVLHEDGLPDEIERQLERTKYRVDKDNTLFITTNGLNYDGIMEESFPFPKVEVSIVGPNLVEVVSDDFEIPDMELTIDGELKLFQDPKPDVIELQIAGQHFYIKGNDLYVAFDWYGTTMFLHINEDGYLVMTGESESLAFRFMERCSYSINDSGQLVLSIDLWNGPSDLVHTYIKDGQLVQYSDDPVYADYTVTFPTKNGLAYMPSGQRNGEEMDYRGLGPHNFFDDYGAEPGDGDFHPYNPQQTPFVNNEFAYHDDDRRLIHEEFNEGGVAGSMFGANPRNPVDGDDYQDRPIFKGVPGTCQTACTGLCYVTCDDFCSESCTTTCTLRCGTACGANCTTGCSNTCSTQCYQTCKTKCENVTGYACVHAGAKTVAIDIEQGDDFHPNKVTMKSETYSCTGCSYSCQFYPNKKTTCWDAGCMGNCFINCMTGCADSCMGGCINNAEQKGDSYKTGKGKGCSASCTINCVGTCGGTCIGDCYSECYFGCIAQCTDNCTWDCSTNCGNGCEYSCRDWCKGSCGHSCESNCTGSESSLQCTGCSTRGGCVSVCTNDCNSNCVGIGCRSLCGLGDAGACEANCRINCMSSSCTAMCLDQCFSQCSTCVNSCDMKCGSCTSSCSGDCTDKCMIVCTAECKNSCNTNCAHSCSEECGACFRGDTLVETDHGYKRIDSIVVGDKVYTDKDRYCAVTNTSVRTSNDLLVVTAVGTTPIHTTGNHKFYVRLGNSFDIRRWVEARKIEPGDWVKIRTHQFGNKYIGNYVAMIHGALANVEEKLFDSFYDWDKESVETFLDGFIHANRLPEIISANKEYIIRIAELFRMAGKSFDIIDNGKEYVMRDTSDAYVRVCDDGVWAKVISVDRPTEYRDEVYNITVSEDHTFWADNVLVHNCSSLCYSCVGQCIGVCMQHCDGACSNCANQCSFWCDTTCDRKCLNTCDSYCIGECSGSCITFATGKTLVFESEEARRRYEEGWLDPNSVIRVKLVGENLVMEIDDDSPQPDLFIKDGQLVLIDNGLEIDEDIMRTSYRVENRLDDDYLYMTAEVLTRADEMDLYMLIREWFDEETKRKGMLLHKDTD